MFHGKHCSAWSWSNEAALEQNGKWKKTEWIEWLKKDDGIIDYLPSCVNEKVRFSPLSWIFLHNGDIHYLSLINEKVNISLWKIVLFLHFFRTLCDSTFCVPPRNWICSGFSRFVLICFCHSHFFFSAIWIIAHMTHHLCLPIQNKREVWIPAGRYKERQRDA